MYRKCRLLPIASNPSAIFSFVFAVLTIYQPGVAPNGPSALCFPRLAVDDLNFLFSLALYCVFDGYLGS